MNIFPSKHLIAALAVLALPGIGHAQWLTTPADANFNNPNNWTGSTLPAAGTTAQFTNNSSITNITVDAARQNGLNITATTSSFVFSGGSFQLSSGSTITTTSTVTTDQTVNSNLLVATRTTGSVATFSANATNGSKLIINGNFAGGQNVAGISGSVSLRGLGGYGVYNGIISDGTFGGNIVVQKTGGAGQNGTWELNGANTYSGGTEFGSGSGTIVLGNKAALGTGQLRIAGGAVFQANTNLSGANAIANVVNYVSGTTGTNTTADASITFTAGSNTGTLVSGTAPLVGDVIPVGTPGGNFLPAFTRITGVSGSTITFSNNAVVTGTSPATISSQPFANGGQATTVIGGTNNVEFSGTQNLTTAWSTGATATQTFNVTNTGTTTFSGVLQQLAGVASIVKQGAGTLILSGANLYTGNTTFSAGTVLLNNASGSATGTSGLIAVTGGTLGGNGFTSSLISINSGASFRPGAATGDSTALLTGSASGFSALILATGSSSSFDINGTTLGAAVGGYDAFKTENGGVSFGGDFTADFGTTSPLGTNIYDLFDFELNGGTNFNSFSLTGAYIGSLTLSGTGATGVWQGTIGSTAFSFSQATGDLTVTSVPEPAVGSLLLGFLGLALVRRVRRKAL